MHRPAASSVEPNQNRDGTACPSEMDVVGHVPYVLWPSRAGRDNSEPPVEQAVFAVPELARRDIKCLPIPDLMSSQASRGDRFLYCVTTICCHGQLGDRALIALLGWQPDQPVLLRVIGRTVAAIAGPGGEIQISPKGYLRLPSVVRHQCRIEVGDRLLLAVCPEKGLAFVHPFEVVDLALSALHSEAQGLTDGDS